MGTLPYKWVGQTWRRRESGRGSEARWSQDTNDGSPLRVESSSAGVSMAMPPPPMWSAPTRALPPPPHTFVTANLMALSRYKTRRLWRRRRRSAKKGGSGNSSSSSRACYAKGYERASRWFDMKRKAERDEKLGSGCVGARLLCEAVSFTAAAGSREFRDAGRRRRLQRGLERRGIGWVGYEMGRVGSQSDRES
nr:unnamed protein product [Digitaria exilis]